MGSVDGEKYCLKWNDFEINIGAAFREMRKENEMFDVTLAGDSFQIKAHKVVLTACSNLFRDILKSNPHNHPLLYLKGLKQTDLSSLVDFVYDGEVNVSQEDLSSFLLCAEELKIKGLSENKPSKPPESAAAISPRKSTEEVNPAPTSNKRSADANSINMVEIKKKKIPPCIQRKPLSPLVKKSNTTSASSSQINSETNSNFVEVKKDPDDGVEQLTFHELAESEECLPVGTIEKFDDQRSDNFGDYGNEDSVSEQDQYMGHSVYDEEYGDTTGSGGMFTAPYRGGNTNRSWVWDYMGFLIPGTGSDEHTQPPRGAPPGSRRVTCKLCYKTFAYHNSTSSLANHLKTYHIADVVVDNPRRPGYHDLVKTEENAVEMQQTF